MANKYYEYTTLQGDTFDSISLDFYNSEKYAHLIMAENPEYIETIVFSSGTLLKIPAISTSAPSSLPPWKRGE
jgi:hypothetical protein